MNHQRTLVRTLLHCILRGANNTIQHDGVEHAGYLSFLTLLSLFPFLVLLVALAGVLGQGQLGSEFTAQLFSHLPNHIVDALAPRVTEIVSGPPQGLLTIAILGAIWTASSAVEGYRTVLNRAYHVNTPPSYILRRLLSIVQLLLFTFILIVSMLLLIGTSVLWHKAEALLGSHWFNTVGSSVGILIYALGVGALLIVVCAMYKVLPNIRQRFRFVFPGAIVTVLLWVSAAKLFSQYLTHFDQVNLIYGSLGGIIATLLFFYFINVIFIFGAEFNYLLMRAYGQAIEQREATNAPQPPDDEN